MTLTLSVLALLAVIASMAYFVSLFIEAIDKHLLSKRVVGIFTIVLVEVITACLVFMLFIREFIA